MDNWLTEHLVCPRDKKALELRQEDLHCPSGHVYPVIEDIPILLLDEVDSTHDYIEQSLELAKKIRQDPALYSPSFADERTDEKIDPFVQGEIPYTSGNLYFSVQNNLSRYPIPEIRLRSGNGGRLLDVGCNWGRWTVAAGQIGYRPIGIDPSLKAVLAARRVAKQLNVWADFVVGDARFLPFANNCFDVVFSYSVYQHLSKENARQCLMENARTLKKGGLSLVQMPNKLGLRQRQQHRRRGYTEGEGFEVRYWSPSELLNTFEGIFGKTRMTADCYFGLGIQAADVDMMPFRFKTVVYASEFCRRVSRVFPPLRKLADSLYIESVNN
jgi:SAM-dependent methyltransferase/uncharacterized protein YbaR (Trm112 family)